MPSPPRSSLRLEIVERTQNLVTAGLGLVAALAWNDAIQSLFVAIFGTQSNLAAKFLYAFVVTALVVYCTIRLSQLINRLKKDDDAPPV
jgi:uncharacterized membrane protein (DUF4010 family)